MGALYTVSEMIKHTIEDIRDAFHPGILNKHKSRISSRIGTNADRKDRNKFPKGSIG